MSGYIGNIPTPQATQSRQSFTATSGQTSFATVGYTPGFVDVYLNGVKLVNGDDFTATNGSDVVLTVGAASGDTVEVLSFSTFEVNSQTFTGGLTVNNDGATVITADRATSDGSIVDFKKDGTTVGSIGTQGGDLWIGSSAANHAAIRFANATMFPVSNTGGGSDGLIDVGDSLARFKDLYLSGGVYLGGTGAANLLDDYEEGTFTPVIFGTTTSGTGTYSTQRGSYIKIGKLVYAQVYMGWTAHTGTGSMGMSGLPFTSENTNPYGYGAPNMAYANGLSYTYSQLGGYVVGNSSDVIFTTHESVNLANVSMDGAVTELLFTVQYIAQ